MCGFSENIFRKCFVTVVNCKWNGGLKYLQSELDETQNALQAAQRLSEQLDKKTEAIAALKEEGQTWCRNRSHTLFVIHHTFFLFVDLTQSFLCFENVANVKYCS